MKLGGWMVTIVGMIMFLTIIDIPTGLTVILDKLGINFLGATFVSADFSLSTLYVTIVAALTAITVGTLVIGFFGKGYDVSLVIVPLIVLIASIFIPTFWMVIDYMAGFGVAWMTSIIAILFSALAIAFIMSCVDYFAGR